MKLVHVHAICLPPHAAELGVDSPEIRELFLSKIYELNNPSSNMADMQDDFLCECCFMDIHVVD